VLFQLRIEPRLHALLLGSKSGFENVTQLADAKRRPSSHLYFKEPTNTDDELSEKSFWKNSGKFP
jgi:hypothetical protein